MCPITTIGGDTVKIIVLFPYEDFEHFSPEDELKS